MEVIHSDVCGPISPSFSGKIYFVTFIDDFSHYATVYSISRKSDAFGCLKDFLSINRGVGMCLRLHTDRGGEYSGHEFARLLHEHGITHTPMEPYTPELNGVAERFNWTLLDMVRPMLRHARLPPAYWAEAASAACAMYNSLPHA